MHFNTTLFSVFLLAINLCVFMSGSMTLGAAASEKYAQLIQRLKPNERITQELIGRIDALKASEIRLNEKVSALEVRESEYLKRLSDVELQDSKLHDTIDELKTQMSDIQTRLEATELRELVLVDQVMQLEKKNDEQLTLVYRLQKQNLQQSRQITSLFKYLKLPSLNLNEKGQENSDSKTADEINPSKRLDVGDKKISKTSSKRLNRIQPSEHDLPVAFFATMVASMSQVGTNQPIIFENAITNVGNAYNRHLGAFIAPVSGIYVFSTTLLSGSGVTFNAAFIHNNQLISKLEIHGGELHSYASESMTVVLQLQKGDVISLHNLSPNINIYGGAYTTFAGFLLQADNSSPAIVG